jgi:hypothetical protein
MLAVMGTDSVPRVADFMIRDAARWQVVLFLWAGVLAACARADDAAFATRDSAGIRIVESRRAVWTEATRWRIGAEPSLDIGGGDSADAYLLHRVVTARVLPGGRVAVANTGTAEVRVFDSTGRHLSTIGRRGQGPGEFSSPWRLQPLRGDSLVVLDLRGFRFNVFGPNGAYVRSYTTPLVTSAEGTELVDWFDDGTALVHRYERTQADTQTTEPIRSRLSLFRIASDGRMLDSLGLFPAQTGLAGNLYIWGPYTHETAHDSTVYVGLAEQYEILRYSNHGKLVGIIRRDLPNRATTPEDVAVFKEGALGRDLAARENPQLRARIERMFIAARYAPVFPPYFYLRTDEPGSLWVQEYAPTVGEGRVWSVFDPEGIYLGDVEMPDRFRVYQIGADFVLGQWRDEDDVEHVRRYGIIKPR